MSTYTGVIAASQKRCNCGAERLTDLFVQQQYMYLTSHPYALEKLDGIGGNFNVGVDLVKPPTSSASLTSISFVAKLIETVIYGAYRQPLSASTGLTSVEFSAKLMTTVTYGEYTSKIPPTVSLSDIAFSAKLITQVIDVSVPPESLTGIYNVEVVLK